MRTFALVTIAILGATTALLVRHEEGRRGRSIEASAAVTVTREERVPPPRFLTPARALAAGGEEPAAEAPSPAPGGELREEPVEAEVTPEEPADVHDPQAIAEADERHRRTVAEAPHRDAERLGRHLRLGAAETQRLEDSLLAERQAIEELRAGVRAHRVPAEDYAHELAKIGDQARLRREEIVGPAPVARAEPERPLRLAHRHAPTLHTPSQSPAP